MKKLIIAAFLVSLVNFAVSAQTQIKTLKDPGAIFTKGQRAPTRNFTGTVWVQQLIEPDSAVSIPVGYVTFELVARSYWHSHPGGQVLLINY